MILVPVGFLSLLDGSPKVYRGYSSVLIFLLLLAGTAWADAPSVGVAGPSQVITIPTGENTSSYIRIYNDGNASGDYGIQIRGNISSMTFLDLEELTIPAGQNSRVGITYMAPFEEGYYDGELVVSLRGNQIVPGVTKEIGITVERPVTNRPPRIRVLRPGANGTLAGDVDIVVDAEDPDGDEVAVSIYVDGELVSERDTYVWKTRRWENGEHEILVLATDGNLTSNATIKCLLENPGGIPVWSIAVAAGSIPGLLLLALLVTGRVPLRRGNNRK